MGMIFLRVALSLMARRGTLGMERCPRGTSPESILQEVVVGQVAQITEHGCGQRASPGHGQRQSICDHVLSMWRHSGLAVVADFEAGAHIVREGDSVTTIIGILSGVAKSYKSLIDGRHQIFSFPSRGDLLGIDRENSASLSVQAISRVTTCGFQRKAFETMLTEAPQLHRRLLDGASCELRSAQHQMLLLGRKTSLERVACFLRSRARLVQPWRRSPSFLLPMSRCDIADYLGITTETVSRNMTILRIAGVVEIQGAASIRIMHVQALEDIADGSLKRTKLEHVAGIMA
jgi:CRP/FNR family transcriptional regulator